VTGPQRWALRLPLHLVRLLVCLPFLGAEAGSREPGARRIENGGRGEVLRGGGPRRRRGGCAPAPLGEHAAQLALGARPAGQHSAALRERQHVRVPVPRVAGADLDDAVGGRTHASRAATRRGRSTSRERCLCTLTHPQQPRDVSPGEGRGHAPEHSTQRLPTRDKRPRERRAAVGPVPCWNSKLPT